MECLPDLFSMEELKGMDEKQLQILHHAVIRELRTNRRIRTILKTNIRKYAGVAPEAPPAGKGSRS